MSVPAELHYTPEHEWVSVDGDVATIGIMHQRALDRKLVLTQQLQTALDSRVIIEQAKGMLAERLQVAIDEAFLTLRRYARNNNMKLTDAARAVAEGDLDIGSVLYAGDAVDAFPDQVRVTVVAGVLLDHVDVNPVKADILIHEAAGVGQGVTGAVLASAGDLRAPGGQGIAQGGVLGQFEAAVGTMRVGLRVVNWRDLFSGEHPAEPVPLHLRHVLDETGQCEAGRRHGRGGGLIIVQALALHREGRAVKVKPAFERGALVGVQGWHGAFDGAHRSIITSGRVCQVRTLGR